MQSVVLSDVEMGALQVAKLDEAYHQFCSIHPSSRDKTRGHTAKHKRNVIARASLARQKRSVEEELAKERRGRGSLRVAGI